MILGIGVDVVDVERMERTVNGRWADAFIRRVFSSEEIVTCRASASPGRAYAARFAAKEAVVKALGTGFTGGVGPGCITVGGGSHARPTVELSGKASDIARDLKCNMIHLSLSHSETVACAFVVLEARIEGCEG
ncbi:MAG: holo-ACP synthase [Pseudomonadota bacterium]